MTRSPFAKNLGENPRLMLVGDSISVQMEPWLRKALRGTIDIFPRKGTTEALKDLDLPRGANGGDSSMVVEALEVALGENNLRPDFSVVNCGLHDIKRNVETGAIQIDSTSYRQNLEKIIHAFHSRDLSFAWIRTTGLLEEVHNSKPGMEFHRFVKDHAEYDRIAMEAMGRASVPCIDLQAVSGDYAEEVFCDHVHFVEEVRIRQAAFLAGWLRRHFLNSAPSA